MERLTCQLPPLRSIDRGRPEAGDAALNESADDVMSNDVVAGQDAVTSVGQMLHAARAAANLSLADVAHSLKFSQRQIERLEADDYAALPGNTVVRGLTRSYARLLRLDADALLQLLDARWPSAMADVRPPENIGVANQPASQRQIGPLASAAVVLTLATILLALWHFVGTDKTSTTRAANTRADDAARTMPAIPVEPPAPPASPAPQAAPASTTEQAAAIVPEQPQPATPSLIFVFEDRSWIEVSDAAKQLLHTGENPAGGRLTLNGRPPFDIVIGNAGKVKLVYGGRAIDLAPHTRAEVARLKLE